jgi:hypothetical protein
MPAMSAAATPAAAMRPAPSVASWRLALELPLTLLLVLVAVAIVLSLGQAETIFFKARSAGLIGQARALTEVSENFAVTGSTAGTGNAVADRPAMAARLAAKAAQARTTREPALPDHANTDDDVCALPPAPLYWEVAQDRGAALIVLHDARQSTTTHWWLRPALRTSPSAPAAAPYVLAWSCADRAAAGWTLGGPAEQATTPVQLRPAACMTLAQP